MKKLDPTSYRTMPWKNGGGTTTELLTIPAQATLESFEARVSIAQVESSGPFSVFVGVDRTLLVTQGAGVTLQTSDGASRTLDPRSHPFGFTGDDPVTATLVDGPVTDFGLMTRRSTLHHHAERVRLDMARPFACAGELTLLLVLDGELVATDGAGDVSLSRGDVLALRQGETVVVRAAAEGASLPPEVLLVDIFRR
jgi:environmental stress-induced protein Ves